MDWTVNDITKICENQQVLCCLSLCYENQLIIITFSNFFNCRSVVRTWAGTFDITAFRYANKGVFLNNQACHINFNRFSFSLQFCQTRCSKFFLNFAQFTFHDIVHGTFITDNGFKHCNTFTKLCFFIFKRYNISICQTVQLQCDDCFGLFFREFIANFQIFFSVSFIFRRTNKRNNVVKNRNHTNQTFHDMKAFFSFFFIKFRTSNDNFFTVRNVTCQHWNDTNLTWCVVINGNHVEIVIHLQICVFQKIVENSLFVSIFFKLNSNTQTITVGFITNFRNTRRFIIHTNIIDFLNKHRFINFIRNFCNDNLFFTTFKAFNVCA